MLSSCLSPRENRLDPFGEGWLLNELLNVKPVVYVSNASGVSIISADSFTSQAFVAVGAGTLVGDPTSQKLFLVDNATFQKVLIFDVVSGGKTFSPLLGGSISNLAYEPSSKIVFAVGISWLAAIDSNSGAVLWEKSIGSASLSGSHAEAINGRALVTFNPMPGFAAQIQSFEGETGASLQTFTGGLNAQMGVRAAPDGSVIISTEANGSTTLLRSHDPGTLSQLMGPIDTGIPTNYAPVEINLNDGLLYVGDGLNGTNTKFFTLSNGQAVAGPINTSAAGHCGPIAKLVYSRMMDSLYCAGGLLYVQELDPRSGNNRRTSGALSALADGLAVYPGDRY